MHMFQSLLHRTCLNIKTEKGIKLTFCGSPMGGRSDVGVEGGRHTFD
jgi:hypothetical protein